MKTGCFSPVRHKRNLLRNLAVSAHAEFVLSIFSGLSSVENNDLTLHQGGDTLKFHNVSYKSRDFESPFYYGARLSYFLPQHSNWGLGVEFFHTKMYLETGDTVQVTGSRGGVPVNDSERIDNTIHSFSISHGLNIVAADAIYRWFLGNPGHDFLGRFQPYVGVGAGAAIPHLESNTTGVLFEEYQLGGPAFLGFTGVNFDIVKHWGIFLEYKFSYALLDDLTIPTGSYEVSPMIHHFIAGVSFKF
jgi:lipid A oxidase